MSIDETEIVKLKFDKSLIDVVFDKFGENTKIEKFNEDIFETNAKVMASRQIFGMLLELSAKVNLIAQR
ncbi:MAG: hypothetical protein RR207_05955 [Clostridia bacterium]